MRRTTLSKDSKFNDVGFNEPGLLLNRSRRRLSGHAESEDAQSANQPETQGPVSIGSIFTQTRSCQKLLDELSASAADDSAGRLKPEISKTKARLKLWSEFVGAAIEGPKSLDERLRDASRAKQLVIDCLEAIEAALRQALPGQENFSTEEGEDGSAMDDDAALSRLLSSATLGSPLSHANAMIDILLRAATAIRPALSADRYEKAQNIALPEEDLIQDEDSNELQYLFPALTGSPLLEKLISASLRRRRILQYTEDYHEKFKADHPMTFSQTEETQPEALDEEKGEEKEGEEREEKAADDHSDQPWSWDTDTDSLVSRARSNMSITGILGGRTMVADTASETGSISSSISLKHHYLVPPFPAEHDNGLRTCIACYLLLPLPNERIWKLHILKDIRPYVCTFPECTIDPDKLYSSQRAWFEHELTFHRRSWFCPFQCSPSAWRSRQAFDLHLQETHNTDIAILSYSNPAAARGREISHLAETRCPFCRRCVSTRKKIESHIGSHQRQIALMALSIMRDIDVDYESTKSDEDEADNPGYEENEPEKDLSEGGGLQLLMKTCGTVLQMLQIARNNEQSRETRVVYSHLSFYCIKFRDHAAHAHRISSPLNSGLVNKALRHLSSLVPETCLPELRPQNVTFQFRLEALNLHWSEIQTQNDSTKLEFTRRWLKLGASDEQRAELERALESCIDDLDMQQLEELSIKPAENPPSRDISETSFNNVSRTAQSIFNAMVDSNECTCPSQHQLTAYLELGTYREPRKRIDEKLLAKSGRIRGPATSGDGDEQGEVDFRILLSREQDWHEVRIRTVEERPVTFAIGDEATTPHRSARTMKVKNLCQSLTKAKSMAACLVLKLTSGQLFKLASERSNFRIERTTGPISLSQCLEERPEGFTEKTKRVLSLITGYAVLHLNGTSWLGPGWLSESINFFQTVSGAIPLRPFIQVQLPMPGPRRDVSSGNSQDDDDGLDEPDISHNCPALVDLAVVLIEVYFAKPFERLARTHDITLLRDTSGRIKSIDVHMVFNGIEPEMEAWRSQIPENSPLLTAIDNCLNGELWEDEDGMALDNATLRSRIYEHVVWHLELHLKQGFSQIPLDSVDEYSRNLDLGSWSRHIVTHEPNSQEVLSPSSTPMRSLRMDAPSQAEANHERLQLFDDEIHDEEQERIAAGTERYLSWRSEYKKVYDKFIWGHISGLPPHPVKIAILDTGIDRDHPLFEAYKSNLKGSYNFCRGNKGDVLDRNGHGTFAAGVILDYAPHSELYILKVAEENIMQDARIITHAIIDAVDRLQVDIISMPFGWPSSDFEGFEALKDAINKAHSRRVLMFAAAVNNGARPKRAYPLHSGVVTCVNSTDTYGNVSSFSSLAVASDINIATVGEFVQSAWPTLLCAGKPSYVVSRSGTSCATSIVTGIAAFLLQYARLHLREKAPALQSKEAIEALLMRCAEEARSGYSYIRLSLNSSTLFGRELDQVNHGFLRALEA